MIRHTAASALKVNTFIQGISVDKKYYRKPVGRKKADLATDATMYKAGITALVRIACNGSNSQTLRDMACDQLSEKIAHAPKFAAFAAKELFTKRDAGTLPEYIFDALICVINGARVTAKGVFGDAVDAVCEGDKEIRAQAEERVLFTLKTNGLLFTHTTKELEPYFFGSS